VFYLCRGRVPGNSKFVIECFDTRHLLTL
jgi:hypothetical protein